LAASNLYFEWYPQTGVKKVIALLKKAKAHIKGTIMSKYRMIF